MSKTQFFPPEHCGWCETMHDTNKCNKPAKPVHLVEHCTYSQCVLGWWDYFDENMVYLFTKPCPVCLPDTWDYVNDYPDSAHKTDKNGNRIGRSLAIQRKMQEERNKRIADAMPEPAKGKRK